MIGFCVKGPPHEMEMLFQMMDEVNGFIGMSTLEDGRALLLFSSPESANMAQWLLDLNGAHATGKEAEEIGGQDDIHTAGPAGHDGRHDHAGDSGGCAGLHGSPAGPDVP